MRKKFPLIPTTRLSWYFDFENRDLSKSAREYTRAKSDKGRLKALLNVLRVASEICGGIVSLEEAECNDVGFPAIGSVEWNFYVKVQSLSKGVLEKEVENKQFLKVIDFLDGPQWWEDIP